MERPREKPENPALGWVVSVREVPTSYGTSHPVFVWSLVSEDNIQVAELRADPFQGILVLEEHGFISFRSNSLENILAEFDRYGWGKPPYIDEVFVDIRTTHIRFQGGVREYGEVVQMLKKLREGWEIFKIYANSDRLLSQI